MKDIRWFVDRMRSMNCPELVWRVSQKVSQKREYKKYYTAHFPVTRTKRPDELDYLQIDSSKLSLNLSNRDSSLFEHLDLFGIYDYAKYKKMWNAGFQTENFWPTETFSHSISLSQREDIGDIRTNWELNRHFQFVGLAKNYYLTRDQKYFDELSDLFYDWNSNNLFLHGVQWTSAMEVSIRLISWSYMYAFVYAAESDDEILKQAENGICVMADYVLKHRARYSSANNHLIVEMLGVGIAGILFDYDKWTDTAVDILTKELPKQNCSDGVNREMSIHYQAFTMEAYALLWHLLEVNGESVPELWKEYLTKMSKFLADSCGDFGETIVFGDCDEGKILDFSGKIDNYYEFVLQLMGCLLEQRFTDSELCENITWLFDEDAIEKYYKKPLYVSPLVAHYQKGGYTFLRSRNRKLLIGFDHAELGFGSIAAHGHADALSIQAYFEGKPVLVDSGTYNYHVPKSIRNEFRSSKSHNTIVIDNEEQAEMQGPFLWGKRYQRKETTMKITDTNIKIHSAICYNKHVVERNLFFDFHRTLTVEDVAENEIEFWQNWIIPQQANIQIGQNSYDENVLTLFFKDKPLERKNKYSSQYNHLSEAISLSVQSHNGTSLTVLKFKES